jgi:catalase
MKTDARSNLQLLPLAAVLLAGSAAAQVSTPQPPLQHTPSEMVDTLHGVFGDHHARAIHTKGVMLEGTFTPSRYAAGVSIAPHLQKASVPVIVRFSNFAGVPNVPDNDPMAAPRGMAIRFSLPDGHDTDMVTHSFNGFPSQNADQFRELLQAIAASGPKAAKPTQLDGYLGSHPAARNFLTSPKPAPASYATLPYFGVNTFKFVNAAGKVTYGRYQIIPLAGAHYLTDAQTKNAAPDYLSREITQRAAREPIRFRLMLQVAGKNDHIDDPSIAWPDARQSIELGTLSITKAMADSVAAEKRIVFMPNSLPKGIEVEDQMVNFRSAAYAVSFGKRQ